MFVGHLTLVGLAGGNRAPWSHCFLWKNYANVLLCSVTGEGVPLAEGESEIIINMSEG